jgi:hypothetical protein
MSVMMIRATVRDESIAEAEAAAKEMFAALDEAKPRGVRYASCRVHDSATFVALVALEDGVENPLPAIPAFRAFQEKLPGWVIEPSPPETLDVVGSYELF